MNENNAAIAYTGAFYIVPDTYTGEITATTDLIAIGARPAGFLSESGIAIDNSTTTEGTRVWQRNQEIRQRATETATTLGLELAEEENEVATELYHGSREVNGVLAVNPANLWSGRAVLDTWDFLPNGDVRGKRYEFPKARVSERGTVTLVSTDITLYPVTLTANPDDEGNTYYRHRLDEEAQPGIPDEDFPPGGGDNPGGGDENEADEQIVTNEVAAGLLSELQAGSVPEEDLPKDGEGNLLNIEVEYDNTVSDSVTFLSPEGDQLYSTTLSSLAEWYAGKIAEWDNITVITAQAQDSDSSVDGYDFIDVNVTFQGGETFTASASL